MDLPDQTNHAGSFDFSLAKLIPTPPISATSHQVHFEIMIISHSHKFIFLKTSKVGGSSFEIALSKYCGPADIITPLTPDEEEVRQNLGFCGPQNLREFERQLAVQNAIRSILGVRRKSLSHCPARKIKEVVGERVWDQYFKFSIVRNPFDYIQSRYYWSHRGKKSHLISQEHFRKWLLSRPRQLYKNRSITHINGTNAADYMIKYEDFDNGIATVCEKTGLPKTLIDEFKSYNAKSGYKPSGVKKINLFNNFDAGIEFIKNEFSEDIREYDYTYP